MDHCVVWNWKNRDHGCLTAGPVQDTIGLDNMARMAELAVVQNVSDAHCAAVGANALELTAAIIDDDLSEARIFV